MTAFRVLDVAELEGRRKLVARELGARAVKLNQFDSQPGQEGFEHLRVRDAAGAFEDPAGI